MIALALTLIGVLVAAELGGAAWLARRWGATTKITKRFGSERPPPMRESDGSADGA